MIEKAAKKIRQMLDAWLERRGYRRANIAATCLALGGFTGLFTGMMLRAGSDRWHARTTAGSAALELAPASKTPQGGLLGNLYPTESEAFQQRVEERVRALEEETQKAHKALANLEERIRFADKNCEDRALIFEGEIRQLQEIFRVRIDNLAGQLHGLRNPAREEAPDPPAVHPPREKSGEDGDPT